MLNVMARFAPACTILCVLSNLLCAAPALTTIQDVLYKADGSRFNGLLQISWTTFQAADASNIATQNVTTQVVNGYLHVVLVPTTNAASPAAYTVVYNSDGKVQFTETWVVPPSTSPLRVADVRSSRNLSGNATVTQTQITDVSGLRTELNIRPTMGTGFAPSRAAVIDTSGGISSAAGNLADCVHVDGSSGPCGESGSASGGTSTPVAFSDGETPSGVVDGVNTTFRLANAPNPASSVALFRNGLAMQSGTEFTIAGSTLSFRAGSVPQPGDVLQAFYRTAPVIESAPGGGTNQLQGHNVSSTAPADGQLLGWVSSNNAWEPVNASARATIQTNGTTIGSEPALNFASGNGITQTCTDSAGVQVTCTSSLNTAVALTHAAAQANRPWFCNSSNGTSSYTCSLPAAALTAYTTGMCLDLLVDTTNASPATLNVDSLGVKSIKQADGFSDPPAGMIVAGRQVRTCYDGASWRLPPSNTPAQNGIVAWNGAYLNRSIVGTNGVRCVNGDGTGGNPTCSADTAIMQPQNYAPDTGAPDAYTVSLPVVPAGLSDGLLVTFKAANTNTSATPTIAVNGLARKVVKKYTGMALAAGDIAANGIYEVRYESSCDCFQMQSLPGSAGSGSGITLQNNSGSTVGTRGILQVLNGTYLTCTLVDTGSKLTQQCEANTTKLVDRTAANVWTAGAKQTLQPSATTEGLNLAPAALPSAASAGAIAVLNNDNSLNIFDGAAWNKALTATTTLASGVPLVGLGGNKVGTATTTGTGNIVFSSAPTLSVPAIGDFSNARHNHTNFANGGTLPVAAIIASFTGTCDASHALFGDGSCKTAGVSGVDFQSSSGASLGSAAGLRQGAGLAFSFSNGVGTINIDNTQSISAPSFSARGANAGMLELGQGSSPAWAQGTNSFGLMAPAAIASSYHWTVPGSWNTAGLLFADAGGNMAGVPCASGVLKAGSPPTCAALAAGDIPALPESQITNLSSDLAAKAPLSSPAFTGLPTFGGGLNLLSSTAAATEGTCRWDSSTHSLKCYNGTTEGVVGGKPSSGAAGAVQSSDGSGGFADSSCAVNGGVMGCAGYQTTGASAGQIQFSQGPNAWAGTPGTAGWGAPAAITGNYELLLPGAAPTNATPIMSCAAPSANLSTCTWVALPGTVSTSAANSWTALQTFSSGVNFLSGTAATAEGTCRWDASSHSLKCHNGTIETAVGGGSSASGIAYVGTPASSDTSAVVTGATHGQGPTPHVDCYDAAGNVACSVTTPNSSGDVTISWLPAGAVTKYIIAGPSGTPGGAKAVVTVACSGGRIKDADVYAPCSSSTPADGAAINSAFAKLSGGGKVLISEGTFYIETTIAPPSNSVLECTSKATRLKASAAYSGSLSINIIELANVSNVVVHGCTFDGNNTTYTDPDNTSDANGNDIHAQNVSDIELYGNVLTKSVYHGIIVSQTGASGRINIHDNTCLANGYRCIHAHGNSTTSSIGSLLVSRNQARGDGVGAHTGGTATGIYAVLGNAWNVSVTNNIVDGELGVCYEIAGPTTAGGADTTQHNIIANNIGSNCAGDGLLVYSGPFHAEVDGNIFYGTGNYGIEVNAPTVAYAGGLTFNGGQIDQANNYGFAIVGDATTYASNIQLSGMQITNGAKDAVFFGVGGHYDHIQIKNLVARNNNGWCINVPSAVPNLQILGPTCQYNLAGGISFSGVSEAGIFGADMDDNGPANSELETDAIGGTVTAGDVLSFTVTSASVTGSPVTVTYTAKSTDYLADLTRGMARAINGNANLVTAGFSAWVNGRTVSVYYPNTVTATFAASASGAATETQTLTGPAAVSVTASHINIGGTSVDNVISGGHFNWTNRSAFTSGWNINLASSAVSKTSISGLSMHSAGNNACIVNAGSSTTVTGVTGTCTGSGIAGAATTSYYSGNIGVSHANTGTATSGNCIVLANPYTAVASPAAAGSTTMASDGHNAYLFTGNSSPIATYTITMPASPCDGAVYSISTDSGTSVTALTLTANTGQAFDGAAPSSIAVSTNYAWRYQNSSKKWFRAQ